MSDHEQLADEAEREAEKFEQQSDLLGDHIDDARGALKDMENADPAVAGAASGGGGEAEGASEEPDTEDAETE